MAKVYVVEYIPESWDDSIQVHGVYSTKEKADDAIAKKMLTLYDDEEDAYGVREMDLDKELE